MIWIVDAYGMGDIGELLNEMEPSGIVTKDAIVDAYGMGAIGELLNKMEPLKIVTKDAIDGILKSNQTS